MAHPNLRWSSIMRLAVAFMDGLALRPVDYEVCQGKIYLSAEISPEIVREYLGITDLPPNPSPSGVTVP